MSETTNVWIYGLDEVSTPDFLGAGTLAAPQVVLVHPRVSTANRRRVRAQLVPNDSSSAVEVVDGDVFVPEEEGLPVMVRLDWAVRAPTTPIPLSEQPEDLTDDAIISAIANFVEANAASQSEIPHVPAPQSVFEPDDDDGGYSPDEPRPPWCYLNNRLPGCPGYSG